MQLVMRLQIVTLSVLTTAQLLMKMLPALLKAVLSSVAYPIASMLTIVWPKLLAFHPLFALLLLAQNPLKMLLAPLNMTHISALWMVLEFVATPMVVWQPSQAWILPLSV